MSLSVIEGLPRFDAAEYLADPQARAAYLAAALEDGDPAEIRRALGTVARAIGMTTLAETAGFGRESLYKALGDTGNPEFATILKLLHAMGLRLSVVAATGE